jgi:hypothetical protein
MLRIPPQPPVREELHAGDPSPQAYQRCGAILALVEWFDDNPHSLVLAKIKRPCWLQNAVPVNGRPSALSTFGDQS